MGKVAELDKLRALMLGFAEKADDRFLQQADVTSYYVEKQATPEDGFASTYQLFSGEGANKTAHGAKINIAADIFVQDISQVLTCEEDDSPLVGFKEGDHYVDFTVDVKNADNPKHLYLNLKDLGIYTADERSITLDDGVFAVKINSQQANGLKITNDGMGIDLASYSTETVHNDDTGEDEQVKVYHSGALSGQDKEKLDKMAGTTYEGGAAINVTSNNQTNTTTFAVYPEQPATAFTAPASGTDGFDNATNPVQASVVTKDAQTGEITGGGLSVDVASRTANGTKSDGETPAYVYKKGLMSAQDKAKLDDIDYLTNNDVDDILASIWPASSDPSSDPSDPSSDPSDPSSDPSSDPQDPSSDPSSDPQDP